MGVVGVVRDIKLFIGEFDLSSKSRVCSLVPSAEMLENTVFLESTRSRKAGVQNIPFKYSGFNEFGVDLPDEILDSKLAIEDLAISVTPENGDVGDVFYFFKSVQGVLTPLNSEFGQLVSFDVEAEGRGQSLFRGRVLDAAAASHGSGETNTTAVQVGALTLGQELAAVFHAIAVTGTDPTLDVILQSDDDSGFASPTARITFTQKSGKISDLQVLTPAAITDDWWRFNITVGGTSTPTFTLFGGMAIK